MNLDKRQWYVHWFFISLAVLDRFGNSWRESEWDYQKGTNLCHFIRVLLVWTPLVVALHLLVYGGAIAALTYFPIVLFGAGTYFAIIVAVASAVVLVMVAAGVLKLIVWLMDLSREKLVRQVLTEHQPVLVPAPKQKVRAGPTFGQLVWQYLVAAKQKVCPTIQFH